MRCHFSDLLDMLGAIDRVQQCSDQFGVHSVLIVGMDGDDGDGGNRPERTLFINYTLIVAT